MVAPLVVAGASAAVAGAASALASVAAGRSADFILGNEIVEIDVSGIPVNGTGVAEQTSPVVVENRNVVNNENHIEIRMTRESDGAPVAHYAARPSNITSDASRQATEEGTATLARTTHGRSALGARAGAGGPAAGGQARP